MQLAFSGRIRFRSCVSQERDTPQGFRGKADSPYQLEKDGAVHVPADREARLRL